MVYKWKGRPKKINIENEIFWENINENINIWDIEKENIKKDTIQAIEEKKEENEDKRKILYIIEWKTFEYSDFSEKEKKDLEKDKSEFYKITWDNYIIYDTDKDTAVYMLKYLIKWIFGSRELDSIKFWHILHFFTIFLILCLVFLVSCKPNIKNIEEVIMKNKTIITPKKEIQNIQKIENLEKNNSWSIIKWI